MYSQAVADEICRRLSEGETLRQICRDEDMPAHSTVLHWAIGQSGAPSEFADQYSRARGIGLDVIAEEIVEIADHAKFKHEYGNAEVQAARVRIDSRKWLLSKLRPEKYGDRTTHEHGGVGGGPVTIILEGVDPKPHGNPGTDT